MPPSGTLQGRSSHRSCCLSVGPYLRECVMCVQSNEKARQAVSDRSSMLAGGVACVNRGTLRCASLRSARSRNCAHDRCSVPRAARGKIGSAGHRATEWQPLRKTWHLWLKPRSNAPMLLLLSGMVRSEIVGVASTFSPGPSGEQNGRALEVREQGQRRGPMFSILRLDMSGTVLLPSRLHEALFNSLPR